MRGEEDTAKEYTCTVQIEDEVAIDSRCGRAGNGTRGGSFYYNVFQNAPGPARATRTGLRARGGLRVLPV